MDVDQLFAAAQIRMQINEERKVSFKRTHFAEFLVRLAAAKYRNSGLSIAQATEMMLKKYIIPPNLDFECNQWRASRLENRECDTLITKFFPILSIVYKKYAQSMHVSLSSDKGLSF